MSWRSLPPPDPWVRYIPSFRQRLAVCCTYLGIATLIVLIAATALYISEARHYDIGEVARLPGGMVVFDRRGRELPIASPAGRKLVKRTDIPEFLVKALLAREDARFFQHGGVDVRGLFRATIRNLRDRDFTQGASTLTMQLTRNTFDMRAKSLHRKILEIALTLRVEANYSKDEILTHYLNRIYFGSGSYGIEQAARTYFGKTTHDLTPGECAMLVGIIRGPHVFSPIRNLAAAIEQRNQTLARMKNMGFVDDAQVAEIIGKPVKITTDDDRDSQPSYALQAVNRELNRIMAVMDIRLDGLKVYTTLDLVWQDRLDAELRKSVSGLERDPDWSHPVPDAHVAGAQPNYLQYAAITTETKTGATLALIGGRDFDHSRFDRSRSTRDLGPAFEPFLTAAVVEAGKPIIAGQPVQTGRQIGPGAVEQVARKCGLSGPFAETEDLFRGSVAATPLEVSIGLATFGNQGRRPVPYLIREIRNVLGDVIYKVKPESNPAITPAAANAAREVLAPVAGTRCLIDVTSSERDAWMLRLGPGGATAVWLGFDKPVAIASDAKVKESLNGFARRLGND